MKDGVVRKISFGKFDFFGSGRRINEIEVALELRPDGPGGGLVFSASASVWNVRRTDIVCGGQIFDEIAPFLNGDAAFGKIAEWHRKYHMNDMHAGTPEQEACLEKHPECRRDYDRACAVLKRHRLLTVPTDDGPYTYGTKWLYRPIPEKDLSEIKAFMEEGCAK